VRDGGKGRPIDAGFGRGGGVVWLARTAGDERGGCAEGQNEGSTPHDELPRRRRRRQVPPATRPVSKGTKAFRAGDGVGRASLHEQPSSSAAPSLTDGADVVLLPSRVPVVLLAPPVLVPPPVVLLVVLLPGSG